MPHFRDRGQNHRINPTTVIIVFSLFMLGFISVISWNSTISPVDKDWDIIIFTQNWPVTVCLSYQKSGGKCSFPSSRNKWTIHGIWPTKRGTKGPWFCDPSLPFHIEDIYGIEPQLKERWTQIQVHKKKNMLWKHEWQKHGTCAAILPSLSTEFKYFSKGLEWNNKYDMETILNQAGVVPRNEAYDPQDVWTRVKNIIGTKPFLMCYEDKTGLSYLQEIRICFSKELSPVDCDGIQSAGEENPLIECSVDRPAFYLSSIPKRPPAFTYKSDHPLVKALKIIRLLQWMTF